MLFLALSTLVGIAISTTKFDQCEGGIRARPWSRIGSNQGILKHFSSTHHPKLWGAHGTINRYAWLKGHFESDPSVAQTTVQDPSKTDADGRQRVYRYATYQLTQLWPSTYLTYLVILLPKLRQVSSWSEFEEVPELR